MLLQRCKHLQTYTEQADMGNCHADLNMKHADSLNLDGRSKTEKSKKAQVKETSTHSHNTTYIG